jgi:hypothetical protein
LAIEQHGMGRWMGRRYSWLPRLGRRCSSRWPQSGPGVWWTGARSPLSSSAMAAACNWPMSSPRFCPVMLRQRAEWPIGPLARRSGGPLPPAKNVSIRPTGGAPLPISALAASRRMLGYRLARMPGSRPAPRPVLDQCPVRIWIAMRRSQRLLAILPWCRACQPEVMRLGSAAAFTIGSDWIWMPRGVTANSVQATGNAFSSSPERISISWVQRAVVASISPLWIGLARFRRGVSHLEVISSGTAAITSALHQLNRSSCIYALRTSAQSKPPRRPHPPSSQLPDKQAQPRAPTTAQARQGLQLDTPCSNSPMRAAATQPTEATQTWPTPPSGPARPDHPE